MGNGEQIGLFFDGGIGDALVSLTTLCWLRKAHPRSTFVALVRGRSSAHARSLAEVVETHPDVSEVRTSAPPAPKQNLFDGWHRVYSVFPPAFVTPYFRNCHPALEYHLTPQDVDVARNAVRQLGAPIVVLHPFGSESRFNWPVERWRELARILSRQRPTVVVGGPQEPPIPEARLDLRGLLTVRQTLALVRQSAGVIAARSFVSIAAADASLPTIVLTPPIDLQVLSDYYFPASYLASPTLAFMDTACAPTEVAAHLSLDAGGSATRGVAEPARRSDV